MKLWSRVVFFLICLFRWFSHGEGDLNFNGSVVFDVLFPNLQKCLSLQGTLMFKTNNNPPCNTSPDLWKTLQEVTASSNMFVLMP